MPPSAFNGLFTLFSEYPVTRQFNDQRIPIMLGICSTFLLLGLIIFNVVTQGSEIRTESVLRGHWYQQRNSNITCQPATMQIGNSYFTNKKPDLQGADTQSDDPVTDYRGSFRWSPESIVRGPEGRDASAISFYYQESPLSNCNITFISLTFDFQIQSCSYSMKAMCSTPNVEHNTPDNYISLQTSFSVLDKTLPKFTEVVQNNLQKQIFGLSKYYPILNLSANALPSAAFPPYTKPNNSLADESVKNRDIMQWSVWLDGFNYTVSNNYHEINYTNLWMTPNPQGKLYTSPSATIPASFAQGTIDLFNGASSGLQIAAIGIGGIRPIPPNAKLPQIGELPSPLPLYINLTESILAIMMDQAGADLNDRVLGTSYLCTITKNPWRKTIPMLAMLIGSCSGVFGGALTVLLFIARRYDSHIVSKRKSRVKSSSLESNNSSLQTECEEIFLEKVDKNTSPT